MQRIVKVFSSSVIALIVTLSVVCLTLYAMTNNKNKTIGKAHLTQNQLLSVQLENKTDIEVLKTEIINDEASGLLVNVTIKNNASVPISFLHFSVLRNDRKLNKYSIEFATTSVDTYIKQNEIYIQTLGINNEQIIDNQCTVYLDGVEFKDHSFHGDLSIMSDLEDKRTGVLIAYSNALDIVEDLIADQSLLKARLSDNVIDEYKNKIKDVNNWDSNQIADKLTFLKHKSPTYKKLNLQTIPDSTAHNIKFYSHQITLSLDPLKAETNDKDLRNKLIKLKSDYQTIISKIIR